MTGTPPDGWPVTGTPPDGWPAGTMRGKDVLDVAKYPKVLYHGKGVKGAAGLQFEGTCFPPGVFVSLRHSRASNSTPTPTKPFIPTSLHGMGGYFPPSHRTFSCIKEYVMGKLGTAVFLCNYVFTKKNKKKRTLQFSDFVRSPQSFSVRQLVYLGEMPSSREFGHIVTQIVTF